MDSVFASGGAASGGEVEIQVEAGRYKPLDWHRHGGILIKVAIHHDPPVGMHSSEGPSFCYDKVSKTGPSGWMSRSSSRRSRPSVDMKLRVKMDPG